MFPFHLFSMIWFIMFWGILIYIFQEVRHRRIMHKKNSDFENDLKDLYREFQEGNILIDEYKKRKRDLENNYKK